MRDLIFAIAILLPVLLGCGLADRVQKAVSDQPATNSAVANVSSNKTFTDKAVDTAVGDEKIGIPECDEAIDILEAQANDPDDNFVTKAVKKTALNTFRDQLKKSIEENKSDKKEVAKFCREFKENMEDSLKEKNSNSSP